MPDTAGRSTFRCQKERDPAAREKAVKCDRPFAINKSDRPSPVKKSQMAIDLWILKERSPTTREKAVKGDRPFDTKRGIDLSIPKRGIDLSMKKERSTFPCQKE